MTNLSNEFLWTLVQKHGIVQTDSVQDNMNRALEKEIRELHKKSFEGICKPQKITPPNPDSKRPMWQTYVLVNGELKRLQVKEKDDFFNQLSALYLDNQIEKIPSPKSYWDVYLTNRKNSKVSIKTVAKDANMYNRFIKDAKLFDKPVNQISQRDIQRWFDNVLDTVNMRNQEFSDVRRILHEFFELAIDEKHISSNPVSVKPKTKLKSSTDNTDPKRLFTLEEYDMLSDYFWERFSLKADSHSLAVLFNMELGLRSGELCGLRWEDILTENGKKILFVRRQVVKRVIQVTETGTKTYGYEVVDYCKKGSQRKIELNNHLLELLELQKNLNHDNDGYIWGNGKRMSPRQLSLQYENACKELGILPRRNHTMRRTVASMLYNSGMNAEYIRKLLGHTTLAMTLKYIGAVATETEEMEKASAIFSSHRKSPKLSVA